jgi:hypothetical protein
MKCCPGLGNAYSKAKAKEGALPGGNSGAGLDLELNQEALSGLSKELHLVAGMVGLELP